MTRPGGGGLDRPVVLLGAPRSGTSLLAEVLGSHPDVTLALEPRLVWRYGNDRRSDQLRPQHATPEVIAHIRDRFAELVDAGGGSRLVEKTPANSVRPDFVAAVLPDARFVHITRDGWSAVPSLARFSERRGTGLDRRQLRKVRRRMREADLSQARHYVGELIGRIGPRRTGLYGPRLAGLARVAEELGPLEAAALQWRTCVDATSTFGRRVPADQYVEIKLEQLDPATMTQVLDHCGLDRSVRVLDRFRELYRREEVGRRRTLTEEERLLVAPYVVPANAALGYPGSGWETSAPDAAAGR